jgi:serine protease inhibitor
MSSRPPFRSRRTSAAAAAAAACLLAGPAACGDGTGPEAGPPPVLTALPRALTGAEQQAIRASNDFGLRLLREVAAGSSAENIVLSPFSASAALGMAFAGADGATADAMRTTLGWGDASRAQVLDGHRALRSLVVSLDPQVTVSTANALWVRDGFPMHTAYRQEMTAAFGAEVRNGDFGPATVADMNAWASRATNGRIPKVVDQLTPEMVAMLMNALYFKGAWRERFDVARTESRAFTTASGGRPMVPMMQRVASLAYAETRNAQVAELPYGNTAYVMTLILPAAGIAPRAWLSGLDGAGLGAMLAALTTREVELGLPRFRLAVAYQLRDALTALGMGIAFRPVEADFTRIADQELFLTHVKQDLYIDVNEAGTEAAAVTQVGVGVTSAPLRAVLQLDRPFLFLIRERLSGTILFAGLIGNPGAS